MSQILVLIYQGLYNLSFIIRSSSDWIHINETSIECGSQSRSWINIKTKTNKKKRQKQNKNNYTHCDSPGYSICGKKLLWPFSCDFFFLPTQHILEILYWTQILTDMNILILFMRNSLRSPFSDMRNCFFYFVYRYLF